MAFQHFYDLQVWKQVRLFKIQLFRISEGFPKPEQYNLTDQLRRAVRSVFANISEGHGRQTFKDEYRFCCMARGSLSEVLNHLIDARDCGYLSDSELLELKDKWLDLRKLLNGYMKYVKGRANDARDGGHNSLNEPDVNYATHLFPEDGTEDFDDDAAFLEKLKH